MRLARTIPLVLFAALGLAAAISCKEETVTTVTLDLGLDNKGTVGFGCNEDVSATCSGVLNCVLKSSGDRECLTTTCNQGASASRECVALFTCTRDGGTLGDCYHATCDSQQLLIERASDGKGGADVHLLVDYIGLGGTPGCRVSELRAWCQSHPCPSIRRSCVEIHLDAAALASADTVRKGIADAFAAKRTLDTDAPSDSVLVRILGVAGSGACTAEERSPASAPTAPVIGCAYSCPTVLSAARGDLNVDFDTPGARCTASNLGDCVSVFTDAGPP